jgi:hypothetical protein
MIKIDIIEIINYLFGEKYVKLLNKFDIYKYQIRDRRLYNMIEDLLWLYYFEEDIMCFKKQCIKIIKYIHNNNLDT